MNIFHRLGCASLCLALSGCAGMHLYSEKRDQQGKDLKAAWAKVDVNGYFVAMHEQRKKLLEADIDSIAAGRSAEVDSALVLLLDAPVAAGGPSERTFYSILDGELKPLAATPDASGFLGAVKRWKSLSLQLQANRARQTAYRKLLRADGADAPSCRAVNTPGSGELSKYAAEYLKELGTLCASEVALARDQDALIAKLPAGTLLTSAKNTVELEQKHAALAAEADVLMAQYRASLEAYAAAVRASQPGTAPSERLTVLGDKVRAVLARIAMLNNVLGNEALADDRIKRIDAILRKLGTSADPGKDAGRAELAAVLVTRVADDAQVLADLDKPLVPMSLLIRRDLEKNRADLATVQADLVRKDMELVRAAQASRVAEAVELLVARSRLDTLKGCYRSMRFVDAIAFPAVKVSPPCDDADSRAALYDAAGRYAYAIGDQRARTLRLEELRRDLKRERQLAFAQANAGQWAVLIDATAGQAVAYAASGQKASDYKDLVQALSLLWIGRGVNQ
ncbi:hypothetical protein LXA47_12115 [Massilia sp. P8910]|uniref:hypothetical protein n=1 Tax=Massilia antarctica TaxID=2765360 RepID=UPI001E5D17BD|nr:hypothetical protein [Massilia antarctica]MCE3604347.1 hypothetical protein [Massilia antarctica]